jgi:hypothetical protein
VLEDKMHRETRLWIFYFVTIVITALDHLFIHTFKSQVEGLIKGKNVENYEEYEKAISSHTIIIKNIAKTEDKSANVV